jgi:hypothetical protein
MSSYKQRGYGIALAGQGKRPPPVDLVRKAAPAIVSLRLPPSGKFTLIRRYVDALHALHISALVCGENRLLSHNSLIEIGFDLRTEPPRQRLLEAS